MSTLNHCRSDMDHYTSFLPEIEPEVLLLKILAAPDYHRFGEYQEFGDYALDKDNYIADDNIL